MMILPYQQGKLDGLCGVYSIVNAIRLMGIRMTGEDAESLCEIILKQVGKGKRPHSIFVYGIDEDDMRDALKRVIEGRYGVTAKRPYQGSRKVAPDRFFASAAECLASGGAVITGIGDDYEMDHWTVIKAVTKKEIRLFDSSGMKKVRRARCTTGKATGKKPYAFEPKNTFFLTRNSKKEKQR